MDLIKRAEYTAINDALNACGYSNLPEKQKIAAIRKISGKIEQLKSMGGALSNTAKEIFLRDPSKAIKHLGEASAKAKRMGGTYAAGANAAKSQAQKDVLKKLIPHAGVAGVAAAGTAGGLALTRDKKPQSALDKLKMKGKETSSRIGQLFGK
mgnify:CR=1 FL=1